MGLSILVLAVGLSSLNCSKEADENAIRVGAIVSMTGMNAMTGAEQKWAYEQAVADINRNGGVYVKELDKKMPMNLIFADDNFLDFFRHLVFRGKRVGVISQYIAGFGL